MRHVSLSEIKSLKEYEYFREDIRPRMMEAKNLRRVHVGKYLTFLFENHETIWYQIQEMIRIEKTTEEEKIRHELQTYNELLGLPGELGCTLLIEIPDPAERDKLLSRWVDLPKSIYVETMDGSLISPVFDDRQMSERRISSVHYLRFPIGDRILKSVGSSHPDINVSMEFSTPQRIALAQDTMAK